jgi:hypothetical protein
MYGWVLHLCVRRFPFLGSVVLHYGFSKRTIKVLNQLSVAITLYCFWLATDFTTSLKIVIGYIKCMTIVQEIPSPKTVNPVKPSVFPKCTCFNVQLYQPHVHASSCPKYNLQLNINIFYCKRSFKLRLSGTFMDTTLWT